MEKLKVDREERVVKGLIDPRKPKVEEVERHNMHHMPYRNLCPVCVQAMGARCRPPQKK